MAFEIVFKYYECLEDGIDYDKSNILSYTKNLGNIFEEVSLEKLASMILTQLARRDVFVFDVEVFELVKKKISYKQSKNNILIKNKKFGFSGETIVVQEIEESNLLSCKQESEVDNNIVAQLKQMFLSTPAAVSAVLPIRDFHLIPPMPCDFSGSPHSNGSAQCTDASHPRPAAHQIFRYFFFLPWFVIFSLLSKAFV